MGRVYNVHARNVDITLSYYVIIIIIIIINFELVVRWKSNVSLSSQ